MAPKKEKKYREVSRVPTEGWSNWVRAMAPDEKALRPSSYTQRDGSGYYCNNITTVFDGMDHGIYEWKAILNKAVRKKGVRNKSRNYVVYVGCAYREERPDVGALEGRIKGYCKNGNHKDDEINRALDNGYELHVRVKGTANTEEATKNAEITMLDTYNYAWNKRKNAPYRKNIPPPVKQRF